MSHKALNVSPGQCPSVPVAWPGMGEERLCSNHCAGEEDSNPG